MVISNKKYEVSDPAYYDPLIAEQKKQVRMNPNDTKLWLELGRLFEARIDMIRFFTRRHFILRYFLPIFALSLLGIIASYHLVFYNSLIKPWQYIVISSVFILALFALIHLWFLRYPPSGSKYFRKAISLDPQCGDAYMHLGMIALRRYQKKTACRFLEQALRLNTDNRNKIEQELKSIYEKEFTFFFSKKSEKEIRHQEIIDHQLEQIRRLRSKNANLEKRVESLDAKVDQVKWETGHKTKLLDKEMKHNISAIRQDYEARIVILKQEAQETAKELANRDFVRLTTEILESKAGLEVQTLSEASGRVESIIGKRSWQAFSEKTRSYLATAEQVYIALAEQEENPDYSLVGMELCKALETEINGKLVEPFGVHLNGNKSDFLKIHQTGENKDRPSYFTYLARVVDQVNYPKVNSLTLGQYHFVLKRALEGDYALKDYSNFLDGICAVSGSVIGKVFLNTLETVVKRYRNVIAHQSPMNKKQYNHLRELILSGNSALLKTCCQIEGG